MSFVLTWSAIVSYKNQFLVSLRWRYTIQCDRIPKCQMQAKSWRIASLICCAER